MIPEEPGWGSRRQRRSEQLQAPEPFDAEGETERREGYGVAQEGEERYDVPIVLTHPGVGG